MTAALARRAMDAEPNWADGRVWLRAKRGQRAKLRRVAEPAKLAGDPKVHIPIALLAAFAVGWRRGAGRGIPIAAASLGADATKRGIKFVVDRRRPPGALLRGKTGPGFPSGHATTATAVALTAAYVAAREGLAPMRIAAPLAVAVPGAVGASRVYLDRHWATDVVAGWSTGLAVAALSAVLYERAAARPTQRPRVKARR